MKHLIIATIFGIASVAANADIGITSPVTSGSTATNTSNSAATNSGNGNGSSLAVNNYGGGDTTLRTTPTVYAPSMVGSFSQANCMMSVSGAASFISFGFAGGVPVDGEHCDFRLNIQQTTSVAMTGFDAAKSPDLDPKTAAKLAAKSAAMLDAAQDMTCLYSDRMRAVLEASGLCAKVKDMATLDHRWNQPRSTQIDYSKSDGGRSQ